MRGLNKSARFFLVHNQKQTILIHSHDKNIEPTTMAARPSFAPSAITSEGTVRAMMTHISDLDGRRRLVMLQKKEREAQAAAAATSLANAQRNLHDLTKRQEELSSQLTIAASALSKTVAEVDAAMAVLRQSESDEPVLLKHAVDRCASLASNGELWRSRQSALARDESTWDAVDAYYRPARGDAAKATAELERLQTEYERLRAVAAAHAAASQSAPPQTVQASSAAMAVTAEGSSTNALIKETLALERRQREEQRLNSLRTQTVLRRECDDLVLRCGELQDWLSEVDRAIKQAKQKHQTLCQVRSDGVCSRCRGACL